LKQQVCSLANENEQLKEIIRTKMDRSLSEKVLAQCTKALPDVVTTVATQATSVLAQEDFGLITAIRSAQRAFCITDPYLPDNPIVFASQGFLDLTKYSIDQVLNRNCRFLQGPLTDLKQVAALADGIRRGIDTSVPILNYKADGTKFWNQVYVAALRDSNNVIVNYVGVQCEVSTYHPLSLHPSLSPSSNNFLV
jgi:PAS domain-containing protein